MDRRDFVKAAGVGSAAVILPHDTADASAWDKVFQKYYKEMSRSDMDKVIAKLEREYRKKYGKTVKVSDTKPMPGVKFAYGLDLSRCIGCRRCVYACVGENNQSRDPQIHYISVLQFKKGEKWVTDLESANRYYDPPLVPEDKYFYMPVQCQHCDNPPCVKVCPTQATWKEKDGIVVVDYDWCIGCRFCMAACPYGARRFNWGEPHIPVDEINPDTHYLGNRPRVRGCVEKCTFCVQRSRKGKYPACVEVCPVGARKFGNILDPQSEINQLIQTKRVFRLKDDLNTYPSFYYFFSL